MKSLVLFSAQEVDAITALALEYVLNDIRLVRAQGMSRRHVRDMFAFKDDFLSVLPFCKSRSIFSRSSDNQYFDVAVDGYSLRDHLGVCSVTYNDIIKTLQSKLETDGGTRASYFKFDQLYTDQLCSLCAGSKLFRYLVSVSPNPARDVRTCRSLFELQENFRMFILDKTSVTSCLFAFEYNQTHVRKQCFVKWRRTLVNGKQTSDHYLASFYKWRLAALREELNSNYKFRRKVRDLLKFFNPRIIGRRETTEEERHFQKPESPPVK